MSWVGNTKELPVEPDEPDWAPPPRARRGGALFWFTGVLTAVLVLLALLVGAVKALGMSQNFAGAPSSVLTWHAVAAVVAILLQLGVRRGGVGSRLLVALLLSAIVAAVFWFYWLA